MKKLLFLLFALVVSIGNVWADKTIYLNPAGFDNNGNWASDDAVFSAYVWNANGDSWISLTNVTGTAYYKATIPDSWEKMSLVRLDSSKPIGWDAKWNQTDDILLSDVYDNILFTITDWNNSPKGNSDYSPSMMNFALIGTASDSFHEGALVANNANDGKTDTRWGSFGGGDSEWFQIAWSDAQTFNTIKLLCENAMNAGYAPNLAFDIQMSNNGTDWTTKHVWGKNAGTNEYITIVLNEAVTAKFVRFQGVKKGTYGYTFFEFEVYNIDYSGKTLNSVTLSTYQDVTSTNVDRTIALSVIGKTADEEEIPTGAITWNNSTPTVGTITNETFNALTSGTTTISATAGGKSSNEITFTVTAPQVLGSVALPYRIWSATQGYGGITATVFDTNSSAFDGDVALSWEGNGPVGAVISGKNITFGAASGAGVYTLKATSNGISVTTPVYMIGTNPDAPTAAATDVLAIYSGTYGMENYEGWNAGWEWGYGSRDQVVINNDNCLRIHNVGTYGFPYPADADLTQYTKLHFDIYTPTTASGHVRIEKTNIDNKGFETTAGVWTPVDIDLTGLIVTEGNCWINIYLGANSADKDRDVLIDNVYFVKEAAIDEEKPVMVSATLASKTHNSATLTLNATDNSSKVKFHIVDAAHSIDATTGLTDQGANFEYTVTGLAEETSYNFTVTAEDAAGNVSDNSIVMESFTTDAAPSGQVLVSGEHTILLNAYHYTGTENYEVVITSDEVMSGLGGSYWNINGVGGTRVDANMTISDGGKKLTITATSNQAPTLYTPLYVMMPGEVNFGQIEFTWIEKEGSDTPVTDKTIYLDPNMWSADSPSYAAYVFTGSVYDWIALTSVENTQFYTATIPGTWENMTLVRLDPNESMSWDAKWNQTPDISLAGIADNTLFTITSWDGGADGKSSYSTSKYTVNASYTVSGHTITVNAYHYTGTENYEVVITSEEEMSGLGGSYWNINGVGGTRVDANMTISDGGKKITVTATSNQAPTLYTPLYVMMPGEVSFGQIEFTWVEKASTVTASVSQYKWATFCSDKDLDFTGITDVKAYIVTGSENGAVTTQQITGTVKAGTGMLLNSDAQGEFSIPVATGEGVDYSSTNKMHGVTAETETVNKASEGYTNYILVVRDSKAAFAYVNSNPATLNKGQAYLTLEGDITTSAPMLSIDGNGETTSIDEALRENSREYANATYYTLDGRRVSQPTKGLYIVNGKKVMIK